MVRRVVRSICVSVLAACLAGCTAVQSTTTMSSYRPAVPPRGIVVVIDGAGGSPDASVAIWNAVREAGLPLYVDDTFDWTHGRNRVVADMTDLDHSRAMSQKLAGRLRRYRATHPNTPIVLVGYSAGSFVVLESTRWLEPDSLHRIVVLAPAVAADYDLRPALVAARNGVDAFTSERDRLLGLGTGIVGTADGKAGIPPAGQVGFDVPPPGYAHRLHPHPWDLSMSSSGNTGSHSGTLSPRFVRTYLLPLLDPAAGPNGYVRRGA